MACLGNVPRSPSEFGFELTLLALVQLELLDVLSEDDVRIIVDSGILQSGQLARAEEIVHRWRQPVSVDKTLDAASHAAG